VRETVLTMEWITVAVLAKELGVPIREVTAKAQSIGIHRTRGAARLRPQEADAIRRALRDRQPARLHSVTRGGAAVSPPAPTITRDAAAWTRRIECECCGLPFLFDGSRITHDRPAPTRCPNCVEHYAIKGEDHARVLLRHRDHETRLRHAFGLAAKRATEYEEGMKAALRTRDNWRATHVEVMLAHEKSPDGSCSCAAKSYPCFTVKTAEAVNIGIAREVERFGTMTDEARHRALHPHEENWRDAS
jgi:hypothetical protein